jgi:hypothetical protein
MTTFAKLNADGTLTDVRVIRQADMLACPHCIMDPQHYREDGTCKCDDAGESIMASWGYRWNEDKARWV